MTRLNLTRPVEWAEPRDHKPRPNIRRAPPKPAPYPNGWDSYLAMQDLLGEWPAGWE